MPPPRSRRWHRSRNVRGPRSPIMPPLGRSERWLLLGFFGLYFGVTGWLAAHRPLWIDEISTVTIARSTVLSQMWAQLAAFDPNPPLTYFLIRACQALPIPELLAARLPALVGFGILLAC